MWKRLTALAATGLASLALALSALPFSSANAGTSASETVIACFHPKIGRFTARAHPSQCRLRGYRGREIVGIPIEGMKWGHWGVNPTRAAFGVDKRDRTRVRVAAFRPIICADGRAWYSRAVLLTFPEGNTFELRLPTCDADLQSVHP